MSGAVKYYTVFLALRGEITAWKVHIPVLAEINEAIAGYCKTCSVIRREENDTGQQAADSFNFSLDYRRACLDYLCVCAVSYTHLTLPTSDLV